MTEIEPQTFELGVQVRLGNLAPVLVDDGAAPGRALAGGLLVARARRHINIVV
jgi:hypothetical protein